MATQSKIEWCGPTWNPLKGCSLKSPGCENCYAMSIAHRFSGPKFWAHGLTRVMERKDHKTGKTLRLPVWSGVVNPVPRKLDEPLRWRKGQTVFVNSMSDLFHEEIPLQYIAAVFGVMGSAPRHTFQVLTKRAERLPEFFDWADSEHLAEARCVNAARVELEGVGGKTSALETADAWPLSNVWLGVSIEDAKRKDRIDHLRKAPAAIRFLSCEPLLEDLGELDLTGIHWVIIGGESGRGNRVRPMKLTWVRNIIGQCRAQGVAVFVKQLGRVWSDESLSKDYKGGNMKDWPRDLRIREFPLEVPGHGEVA